MNTTKLLCYALGWQGGTIHQVAQATGLTQNQILGMGLDEELGVEKDKGWFAVRTCSVQKNAETFRTKRGNLTFWTGAAQGIATAIKLREPCQGYIPKIRFQYYVGLGGRTRQIFKSAETPTRELCPEFLAVIGPFRTKRGAEYMAAYGANNPHCRNVREAEILAKTHK